MDWIESKAPGGMGWRELTHKICLFQNDDAVDADLSFRWKSRRAWTLDLSLDELGPS